MLLPCKNGVPIAYGVPANRAVADACQKAPGSTYHAGPLSLHQFGSNVLEQEEQSVLNPIKDTKHRQGME